MLPTHSRFSTLAVVVRPPLSGQCCCPYVPDDIRCHTTRMDVEMTFDRYPDSLVDIGLFDPRAGTSPTQEGICESVPMDKDPVGGRTRAAHIDCRGACLGAARIVSGADPEPVQGLRQELDPACLLALHDVNVASSIADRVAVVSAGRIVKLAEPNQVHHAPGHPDSSVLLDGALMPVLHARPCWDDRPIPRTCRLVARFQTAAHLRPASANARFLHSDPTGTAA